MFACGGCDPGEGGAAGAGLENRAKRSAATSTEEIAATMQCCDRRGTVRRPNAGTHRSIAPLSAMSTRGIS